MVYIKQLAMVIFKDDDDCLISNHSYKFLDYKKGLSRQNVSSKRFLNISDHLGINTPR